MKTMLIASFLILLSSCTTLPQKAKFPKPPEYFMTEPEPLICAQSLSECEYGEELNGSKKRNLSEVTEIIIKNYGKYHELVEKHKGLQLWILEQEKLQNE